MNRITIWSFLLAIALATPGQAGPARNICEAPDEVSGVVTSLPAAATTLKPNGTLEVLAVGSAGMFGPEASLRASSQLQAARSSQGNPPPGQMITAEASDRAFPRQMARALEVSLPGAKVQVTVRGGRGLSASEMLAVIKTALAEGHYQLVLWQTGTIEAVRNTPPGEFAQTLVDGAEAVEAAGANLVLIDPQFSRFLQTNSNLEPYEQAFQQAASMPGVMLFRRFDLMRAWVNEGQIDLERTPKPDRQKVVEAMHACLGAHLARMVLAGVRS